MTDAFAECKSMDFGSFLGDGASIATKSLVVQHPENS